MHSQLSSVEATIALIEAGRPLVIAGDLALLERLPAGNWLAGSIPYFIGDQGGVFTRDRLHVSEMPVEALDAKITTYDADALRQVYVEAPANGLSVIIVPGFSDIHMRFALEAPHYPEFAARPLVGWISGVALDEIGHVSPVVVDGSRREVHTNRAVVMHVTLPRDRFTEVGIINLFDLGSGPRITFPSDGFSASEAEVDGRKVAFADYVREQGLDTQLPLVADYSGARINVSFRTVEADRVQFYAPVFAGVEYRQASPLPDYVRAFEAVVPHGGSGPSPVFACNCILNWVYAELEGKRTGDFTGPATFGEIAYQLLNQTLAYATVHAP